LCLQASKDENPLNSFPALSHRLRLATQRPDQKTPSYGANGFPHNPKSCVAAKQIQLADPLNIASLSSELIFQSPMERARFRDLLCFVGLIENQ
jgi:hypothetical protein